MLTVALRSSYFAALAAAALVSFTADAAAQYPAPGQYAPPPAATPGTATYGVPGQYTPPGSQPYAPPGQYLPGQPYAPSGQVQGYGYGPQQYGYNPYPYAPTSSKATALEKGFLYGTAAAWGVGTGIWIDAEAGVDDPGLLFLAPAALGIVAPLSVLAVDKLAFKRGMPEGLPAALTLGMLVGAAEGLGISSHQWVSAAEQDEWGFTGLARASFIGSTLGGLGGVAYYKLLEPKPQSSVFVASSVVWGSIIGSEFGAGASNGKWGLTNDSMSLGGLIGFNAALVGSVTLTGFWEPSYNQISWMWAGLGIGTAASLPVYIFYAADSDYDPRRGLILQGAFGLAGLVGGAFIGKPSRAGAVVEANPPRPRFARLLGGGLFPVAGGAGAQIYGLLE